MFKNLLVPTTGGPGDAAVFATARLAAVAFAAHLEFLHVRIDTTEVLMSMTSGGVGGGGAVGVAVDLLPGSVLLVAEGGAGGVGIGVAAGRTVGSVGGDEFGAKGEHQG